MGLHLNRREFISTSAAGIAAAAALPARTEAQGAPSAREIDELFDRSIVIDTLGGGEVFDDSGRAALKESGYTCIQMTLPSGEGPAGREAGGPWSEGNFEDAMAGLKKWQDRFQQNPNLVLHCTKAAHIEQAKREKKLAVILGFQNAPFKDDVANVDKLFNAGCRCVQLTYNSRNNLGDGCTERLQTGLSDFGIACVERMNELGMVVDLSHCGEGTSAEGIAFSAKQPACFTHTFCQALHYHPRGKSDALLRAMANAGGVSGICMVGYFLTPGPQATLDDYLNHLDHAVKVCGIEHVGMSTDTPLRGRVATTNREAFLNNRGTNYKPNYTPRWAWAPELDKPDRYRTIAHGLAKRGYKTGDIEKVLGANWTRYFKEIFRG